MKRTDHTFADAVRRHSVTPKTTSSGNAPSDTTMSPEETARAVKGVLGMMRFADYNNPLLLEALGDLLSQTAFYNNGKLLAARAYLAASYEIKGKPQEQKYRQLAQEAIANAEPPLSLKELESNFATECKKTNAWYTQLHQRELAWIQQGGNVDAQFDKLYSQEPEVDQTGERAASAERNRPWTISAIVGVLCVSLWQGVGSDLYTGQYIIQFSFRLRT